MREGEKKNDRYGKTNDVRKKIVAIV